jgi:serine/threonine protein kinase
MTSNAEKAQSIFLSAIEEHEPEQWPVFLALACADDGDLRTQVERLLRAHAKLGTFHEKSVGNIALTIDQPVAERLGTQIGPYKLHQEIGEGGMGVVYMALQKEPVRRKVALKIIKPGMDTREVIARFAAEEQALAIMDHPNIARVFDAGTTETGRPYFVMELVNGVPITQYCDDNHSTTGQRLELFTLVCHAVQHAHQKGIIHRDIKPSNILVTLHEGVPVPKIIDFGIAKAIHQELTSQTMATGVGHMIGTPLYMSPEQAERSGLDIDTRSDIYSLGVLLYELLTGSTPFERGTLKDLGLDEMRRLIREQEPPRPSTRISTMGKAATTVSEHRRTNPVELSNSLRHELDWIVMKALEKDRTRRYESATDFARDIQRYLRNEAVEACPPSTVYRLKKFVRRNRLITAVSMIAVLGIVVALGVSSYLSVVSRDAAEARSELAEQRLRIQQQCSDILGEVIQLKETANEAHQQKIDVNPTRDKLQLAIALAESNAVDSGLMAQLHVIDGDLARNERERKLLAALDQAWSNTAYTDVDAVPFVGRGRNRRISLVRSALTDYGIQTGVPFNGDGGVADRVRSILRAQ